MRAKFISLVAGILFASILSGCGGSSSSTQTVSTGVYKDAGLVSGLQYATPTQSGVTDQNGSFKYSPGETVTFSVSNVTIGQAAGAPVVTTFDMVGIEPPTSSFGIPTNNPTSKKFQEAINISLFLQTLDDDSDPTNGIAIPVVVNSVVALTPINFKLTSSVFGYEFNGVFRDSPQFKVFIGSCRTAGAWGGTKAIKQLGYAANSLYQGLGIVPSVYLESQSVYSDGYSYNNEYISSGLLSKRTYNNNSESPDTTLLKTYDQNGNIVNQVETNSSNSVTSSISFSYDANGNPSRSIEQYGLSQNEFNYEYDINGNKTLEIYRFDGVIQNKTLYTYNANGTLATQKIYTAGDALLHAYSFNYNSSLALVNIEYNDSANSSYNIKIEYDGSYNVSKLMQIAENFNYEQNFIYDNIGNLLGYTQYENNLLVGTTKIIWNGAGYPVTTNFYDSDNQLVYSTVVTYDENGSRIRTVYESGGITSTTTSSYINQVGWGDMIDNLASYFGGKG